MRKLGLIGGLGPGATVHYYRELAKANVGEFLVVHADLKQVLSHVDRGDRIALAAYFARLIERLALGGAEVAAISAVAPHICIRELEKISALPVINAAEETRVVIHSRGYRKVALFGTRAVMESRLFGMLDGIDVMVPDHTQTIHDAYMQIVAGNLEAKIVLSNIASGLLVDAIVLAGTDLSTIFTKVNTPFSCVDCAQVHIDAITRAVLE